MRHIVAIDRTILAGLKLCCLLVASGCASTMPPTSSDVTAAQRGGQMFVLLRVATRSSTGESIEPFPNSLAADNVGVAVGSFETGGEVRQIENMRFLSDKSRADGWFFAVAPRGTHYFAFLPPQRTNGFTYMAMFSRAKRWRVDAPATVTIVYAGSLIVDADESPLLFGGKYISHLGHMEVRDDTKIAQALVKRFVPDISGVKTVLMVEHEGPIILTTPTK